MVCMCSILFSVKNERNSDTGYKMDKSWKHAKCNKPGTKVKMLYYSTYMRYLE